MSKALSRMSRRAFIAETICDGRHRKKGPTSMTDSIGRAVEIAGADASFGQWPKSIGARIRRVEDRSVADRGRNVHRRSHYRARIARRVYDAVIMRMP